jgi:flagellar hook assembly protein FlgD
VIRRLPQIAFALIAVATIGAFFLVQAIKTKPPVLWRVPKPTPTAIDPTSLGRSCRSQPTKAHPLGVMINYRHSEISLSLSHNDTVGVYIVSAKTPDGNNVATLSSGTAMTGSPTGQNSKTFVWDGRLSDGQLAPNGGLYYFRVVLQREGTSINFSKSPVQVLTQPPDARILSVRLLGTGGVGGTGSVTGTTTTAAGATTTTGTVTTGTATTGTSTTAHKLVVLPGPAVLSPPVGRVRINFTPGTYRRVTIDIYRTDVAGRPELVDPIPVRKNATEVVAPAGRNFITWNGKIDGAPAPAGTYLVGITAQNLACDRNQWPLLPPVGGTTANAGVTVRYLSVTPPLTPTTAGARAKVAVSSAGSPFSWQLRRSGTSKTLAHGGGKAGSSVIAVRLPRHAAGLYTLRVHAGTQSSAVPLVASQAKSAGAHTPVLVVLPMLTWMGDSPVDDSGDGVPDTLRAGTAVSLARPLVDGPPAGFGADATLLAYLTAHHLSYQLTTDVALAEGVGPSLADRGGVVFPEGEDYVPAGLQLTLRGFVRGGGRLLALGTRAFSGVSHISGFPATPRAGLPRLTTTDLFGARRGPVTPTGGELISSVSADAFSLFHDAGEFAGFSQYQPIRPPAGSAPGTVSALGIGSAAPAIVAFRYGGGTVVEVGLSGFAASLAHNPDSSSLLGNVWQLLSQ